MINMDMIRHVRVNFHICTFFLKDTPELIPVEVLNVTESIRNNIFAVSFEKGIK